MAFGVRYTLSVRALAILMLAACVCGCESGPLPDPNDPAHTGPNHGQVLRSNLRWASEAANLRVAKGEITQAEADHLVAQDAAELAKYVDPKEIEGPDAWKYGDLLVAAHDWPLAERALRYAAEHP